MLLPHWLACYRTAASACEQKHMQTSHVSRDKAVCTCAVLTRQKTNSAHSNAGIGALGSDDEVLLKAVEVGHGDVWYEDAITAAKHITLICQRKQSISFDKATAIQVVGVVNSSRQKPA